MRHEDRTVPPEEADKIILAELMKWLRCGDPCVPRNVLRDITGLRRDVVERSLYRLKDQGLVAHECRVGERNGRWRYVPPVDSGVRTR